LPPLRRRLGADANRAPDNLLRRFGRRRLMALGRLVGLGRAADIVIKGCAPILMTYPSNQEV
jgi:hypothetical protein